MTLQALKRLIALGEGYHLEFKRKVPQSDRIAKEIIAFANSHGGKLLLGVDDDGTVSGVKDSEEQEFELRRALAYHCDPPVEYTIEHIPVTSKRDVLMVHVYESGKKPHYLVADEKGAVRIPYVRVKDKSLEASREVVRVLRSEQNGHDVQFEFGDREHTLMQYLDRYERITVGEFAKIANISKRRAAQTLVLLVRANILRLHAHEKADFYTLAYDLPD
jgi:predicted HTH transcriptional regulator